MTFDEKMDRVEYYFSLRKYNFINPNWGIVAVTTAAFALVTGYNDVALIVALTSTVISCLALVISQLTHNAVMKGFKILDSCCDDLVQTEDAQELMRRMKRHTKILNSL